MQQDIPTLLHALEENDNELGSTLGRLHVIGGVPMTSEDKFLFGVDMSTDLLTIDKEDLVMAFNSRRENSPDCWVYTCKDQL